ncbi:MAG: efflux RND transporter permease subunit [Spirochaetaceae bacterium]
MLTRTIVNRPTTFFVIFALLTAFGLYTALDLPVDLFPEIEPAVLVVQTSYEGAGPQEVERTITRSIEGTLSNVSNINQISSTSSQGSSQVILEFTWGTNMDAATNEVRDRLELVRNALPDDAGSPSIFRFDPSLLPILQLRVTGNRSAEELRRIAEDIVQPRIEQLEGIALTSVSGGRQEVIRVEIPQSRLDAYGLTFSQIAQRVRVQNLQIGGGTITENERNYVIQTDGEFGSIDDVRNVVITTLTVDRDNAAPTSTTLRLGDIADVREGFGPTNSLVYVNGEPGVSISVQKQSDANSVEAADNVLEALDSINGVLPDGVQIEVLVDTTQIIRDSLATVSSQAVGGAVLAIIILLLFLRSIRATLVVAVSIPTSIVFTVSLMYFSGLTLNLMTLAGLALGVGLLVDNSIVILENIYRYREKGAKLRPAAILGTQEMINAIVSATLTTVCVFLPVALFRNQLDFIGELFSGLAFTVVISLAASLLVAIFLVPVLASHYFPLSSHTQKPLKGLMGFIDSRFEAFFGAVDRGYKRFLSVALKHRTVSVLFVLFAFIGGLFLVPYIGFELLPAQQQDNVQLNVTMPVGTRIEVTRDVLAQFEDIIRSEITTYERIVVSVGGGGGGIAGFGGGGSSNSGSITITLPAFDERVETETDIQTALRPYFNEFPGAQFEFGDAGGPQLGGGAPIDIRIRTEDIDLGRSTAEEIRELLETEVPEAVDARTDVSEGLPQASIQIDRQRVYALGLDVATIGNEVRASIDGITASRLRTNGLERDILLILAEQDKTEIPDLGRIQIPSPRGGRVPLSSIADFERTTGPVSILREAQARQFTVTAGLAQGAQIAEVEQRIQRLIRERIPLEDGLVIEFSGEFADILRYGQTFAGILVVAVLLVFGVMAAQFESFVDPLIIFLSIPLTLIGVFGIHFLMGINISVFTAVGLVMLVGIVVNNGIVLVDYTNLLRARGVELIEACVEAGGNRLRPILMTTLTTVLGLVPIGFLDGEGSELIRPIALTVIGGLSVSAVLTLVFVPVLYASFNRISERRSAKRAQRIEQKYEASSTAEETGVQE